MPSRPSNKSDAVMDMSLVQHITHEVPKAAPSVGVVVVSGFLGLPWQQLGYVLGCGLILLQAAYSIWKWRSETRERSQKPRPTVPPSA